MHLRIGDVETGDILLNKNNNIEYLVVDVKYCEDDYYNVLYLREYSKIKKSLEYGNMIKVDSYNDYTIEINADNDGIYINDRWEMVDHINLETIRYFKLRGLQR